MFVNSDFAEDFSLHSVLRFLVAETQVFLSTWMDIYVPFAHQYPCFPLSVWSELPLVPPFPLSFCPI